MEPKINEINPIDYGRAYANEVMRGGLPPKMQWYFEGTPFVHNPFADFSKRDEEPITEDIPYEIVENDPKQLPPSK